MILLPAVDISGGRAVRLRQGDFDDETIYADDPVEAARSFVEQGARFLHVVDLDGARAGAPVNLKHLRRIVSELDLRVQYGGGLRDLESVRRVFAAGGERAVIGTAAYSDPAFLRRALDIEDADVAVAIDVRGGRVAAAGWLEDTGMTPEEVIWRMQDAGVRVFVYTSVDRDGMLSGPDLDEVRRVARAVQGRFIYSGGIGSLDDLRDLRDLNLLNLDGVISGKALYERRFTVKEGQRVLWREA